MKKRWFKVLFRRRAFVCILIALQIALLLFMTLTSLKYFHFLNWVLGAISVLVVLYIIRKNEKTDYKLSWIMLILVFPLFGGLFYLLFRFQSSTKQFQKRIKDIEGGSKPLFEASDNHVVPDAGHFIKLPRYLDGFAKFPAYANTRTSYLTPGEEMFDALMDKLRGAKKYIFLEYFIIAGGTMWNAMLGVLKEKAGEGVEVRILYDDMGCFLLLPADFTRTLAGFGISCRVFSPFRPVLSSLQNNRDHRKIAIVDGQVAFTGGINLADEYINEANRFGHWKDSAIMLEGDGAWSFTLMFLNMWSLAGDECYKDYSSFLPTPLVFDEPVKGQVQPYCDSPLDHENIGEHVYLHIINSARDYLYINSPYVILDGTVLSALTLAAKSGVDVRICTPQRWDKRLVHMTTRSYYRTLIKAGVKVYEYRNGFMHSKTFVADDIIATVGTTNLDFRSLYLHFECGCCLYGTSSVLAVKEDYLRTLELCTPITLADCHCNWFKLLLQDVLRLFAPLM